MSCDGSADLNSGAINETVRPRSNYIWYPPANCDETLFYSTSKIYLGTLGRGSASDFDDEDSYKIHDKENLQLISYFEEKPNAQLDPDCENHDPGNPGGNPVPVPMEVEFEVSHGDSYDTVDYEFTPSYSPDEDDNDDDDTNILTNVLDIVGAIGGSTIGLGAAFIKSYVDFSSNDSIEVDTNVDDAVNDGEYINWQILHSGTDKDAFPSGPCDADGVSFQIDSQNRPDAAESVHFNTSVSYTYLLPHYDERFCPCIGTANVYRSPATTVPISNKTYFTNEK